MDSSRKQDLRDFFTDALRKRGDQRRLDDDESIFASGRLDSFSMMMLVMHLEQSFGIDFSDIEFDADLLDSINDIESFVDARPVA